jgi:hypothetical protein
MNMKPYLFLFTILCLSCASGTEKEEQALRKEIMDTHDELIPKVDNIRALKEELQENKANLTNDSIAASAQGIATPSLDSLIQALDEADNNFMNWMKNYNDFNEASFSHEEQMKYLQQEKEKLEDIKLQILSSVMQAQNVVESDF